MPTRNELDAALSGILEPDEPADGDCLVFQVLVTNELQRQGYPAYLASVIGWADVDNKIIMFGHQATEVDGWIVDFTARQFNDQIPARWIIPADRYPTLLAGMTFAEKVTFSVNRQPDA